MTSSPDLIPKYQDILNSRKGYYKGKAIRNVRVSIPNLQGEHMASTCKYITLELVDEQDGGGGGTEKIELFVKEIPENKAHAGMLEELHVFAREAQFFNELLPDMQKYYIEKSGLTKPLDFFPNCFYADDKEIIMENLVKTYGYHLNPKEERQDLEYARMTLENYAQFHAAGYAMIKEFGKDAIMKKYGCLEEIMFNPKNAMFLNMFENVKRTAVGLLNNNDVPGGQASLKILEKYGENLVNRLCQLPSHDSNHLFYVIGHGDAWNNNMMFLKDTRTNKLKHHILLDFQIMRCASPNLDLTYFLYTSVKPELRKSHLKQLLRIYFEKLSFTVKLMTKAPFPFTFEEFLADFKSKSLLGFWMNIFFNVIIDVLASLDPTKMEGDMATFFHDAITKWMEENPEKSKDNAMVLVEFFDEYESFLAEEV